MKPFEIPYNFDKKLIDFLNIYSLNIHCIYLPPYRDHYLSAKSYYQYIPANSPQTIKDYESHIKYIQTFFPDKIMLLLQQNNSLLEDAFLNYYLELGITKFCVGSIQEAKHIKTFLSTSELLGSITMKIDNNKLLTNQDYNIFNGFVLWFPFNRDIELIKKLPLNFNYSLLLNCSCSIYCQGTQHWLAKNYFEEKKAVNECPKNYQFKDSILIPQQDLLFFDKYISYYKLQGREYSTQQIINDIVYYNNNNNLNKNLIKRVYDPYIIYNIK